MSKLNTLSFSGPPHAGATSIGTAPFADMLTRTANHAFATPAAHISPAMLRSAVRVIEFLLLSLSGLLIALSYISIPPIAYDVRYLTSFVAVAGLTVISFELMGLYTPRAFSSYIRNFPQLLLGWTVAVAIYASAVFFLKAGADFSRAWLALWFVTGSILLLGGRIVLATLVRGWAREGRLFRRAVLYGVSDVTDSIIADIESDSDHDVRITAIFDDRGGDRTKSKLSKFPLLGGLEELEEFCRKTQVDLVIVALPIAGEARLAEVVRKISVLPADIKLPAISTSVRFSPRTYSHVGSVAMIDLYDKPIANWGTVSKWLFDKVVGATAIVLLAPVMAGVALAVKMTSKGPVLFRQKRYGFNNELIEVFKFRSMYTDLCDADANRLVSKSDPRVTPVGKFIRKTSLDELPQLFNVMLGTLSLVGPRPHAVKAKAGDELYDKAVDGYFARHKVKPGITGWAQINGWRGETDTTDKIQNRVAHDLYYIEHWSLLFDLYILLRTPVSLIKNENAY